LAAKSAATILARSSREDKAPPALVDTEGLVMRAKVHAASVFDLKKA
jgi:hypothetical protein